MKTVISTLISSLVSSLCIVTLVMSGVSYANANVVMESTFTMCSMPLTAEAETVPDSNSEEQFYTADDNMEINDMEDVMADDPIKYESVEPVISDEETEEIIETTNITEEVPSPAQTVEPDIEEIVVTDTVTPEPVTETTPAVSAEPAVSAPVIVNYINGQLPLGNYAFGAYVGRLSIPSAGIDVAVYHSNSQSVVDAIDSAGAYYGYESQPDYANYAFVIADHNTQGFNAIKNCVIGTEAYIITSNGTYSYVCDRIIPNGHNEGYGILDENYNMVYNQENGGMWLQTCNDTWENDTLVHFHYK